MEKIIDQVKEAHPGDVIIIKILTNVGEDEMAALKDSVDAMEKRGIRCIAYSDSRIELEVQPLNNFYDESGNESKNASDE